MQSQTEDRNKSQISFSKSPQLAWFRSCRQCIISVNYSANLETCNLLMISQEGVNTRTETFAWVIPQHFTTLTRSASTNFQSFPQDSNITNFRARSQFWQLFLYFSVLVYRTRVNLTWEEGNPNPNPTEKRTISLHFQVSSPPGF